MNGSQAGNSITEETVRKRRTMLFAGISAITVLAIGGAVFSISASVNASRAERVASKDHGFGMTQARGPQGNGTSNPGQWHRGGFGNRPGGGGDGPRGGQRGQQMAQMVEQLGLDQSQQTQMKAIQEAAMPQMRALRDDTSLSPEDRRAKFQQMREQMQAQMRQLMTPDQQAKFDQWQAERQQRRQEMRQRREQTVQNLEANGQQVPSFGGRGHGGFGGQGGR